MVKTRSLYLTWLWIRTGSWRTDRRTDRIPIANTRSQQYLLVPLSRVIILGFYTAIQIGNLIYCIAICTLVIFIVILFY